MLRIFYSPSTPRQCLDFTDQLKLYTKK